MPKGVPRRLPDRPLIYHEVDVTFLDGSKGRAQAEGNNATWLCKCNNPLPLVGRCYYQFGWKCHTICPVCRRYYRVTKSSKKRAKEVIEIQPV